MSNDNFDALFEMLNEHGPGKRIEPNDQLLNLLAECWHEIQDSDLEKMSSSKLKTDRVEDLSWNPPILRFVIERHGGTVMGSSRAELQEWIVNLSDRTARSSILSYRQVYKRQPPLNTKRIAGEIVELILSGKDDERLKWSTDRLRVTIRVGRIIPNDSAVFQTVVGRRKRLRKDIEEALKPERWFYVSGTTPNTYEYKPPEAGSA